MTKDPDVFDKYAGLLSITIFMGMLFVGLMFWHMGAQPITH